MIQSSKQNAADVGDMWVLSWLVRREQTKVQLSRTFCMLPSSLQPLDYWGLAGANVHGNRMISYAVFQPYALTVVLGRGWDFEFKR